MPDPLHMRPSAAVAAQELAEATGLRARLHQTGVLLWRAVLFCSGPFREQSQSACQVRQPSPCMSLPLTPARAASTHPLTPVVLQVYGEMVTAVPACILDAKPVTPSAPVDGGDWQRWYKSARSYKEHPQHVSYGDYCKVCLQGAHGWLHKGAALVCQGCLLACCHTGSDAPRLACKAVTQTVFCEET